MTKSDAELLSEIVAAFSTVVTETTRAIARNSGGNISRNLIAIDLQKQADNLPKTLGTAKRILGNIAAQMDDKPISPIVFASRSTAPAARPSSSRAKLFLREV
jgi:hypothetical protein